MTLAIIWLIVGFSLGLLTGALCNAASKGGWND
jgi:uncharacterized membrane protein YeaQ/YmgE (transglycosylase-associated protein family)